MNVSDSVTTSEQAKLNVQITITVSDSVTDTEQTSIAKALCITVSDSVGHTEQVGMDLRVNVLASEAVATVSAPSFIHVGGPPVIPPTPVFTGFRTTGVVLSPFSR